MEFMKVNFLNTTTLLTVNSNTATAANLFSRDEFFQYYTDGLNNDATTSSITVIFSEPMQIDRVVLMDTNANKFRIFYDGVTANTFSVSGGSTSTTNYTTNAEENLYFRCGSTACTSVTIDIYSTQTANQEKRIGQFIISELYVAMDQIPNSRGYKPSVTPKQVVHKMSDGGTRIHNVRKKWNLDIKVDYISETLRDDLREVYNQQDAFIFSPFGTSTSWDGILFESVWIGDFDFFEYSDDATASGFSGKITLRETPA